MNQLHVVILAAGEGKRMKSATAKVLQKIAGDIKAALESREVREQYAKLAIDPSALFLDEFAKFVRAEMAKYQQVVKRADIQPM